MKVREMKRGIVFGQRLGWDFYPAHMLQTTYGFPTDFQRAYCGVYVVPRPRREIRNVEVCKRCLKVSEAHYA